MWDIILAILLYMVVMSLPFIFLHYIIKGHFEDEWRRYANFKIRGHHCPLDD